MRSSQLPSLIASIVLACSASPMAAVAQETDPAHERAPRETAVRSPAIDKSAIDEQAIERAVRLYRPPAEVVTIALELLDEYDVALDPIRVAWERARLVSESAELTALHRELHPPMSKEDVAFPRIGPGPDPVPDDDPRWARYAELRAAGARERRTILLQLRAANEALLERLETLMLEHGADATAARGFASRVAQESIPPMGSWGPAAMTTGCPADVGRLVASDDFEALLREAAARSTLRADEREVRFVELRAMAYAIATAFDAALLPHAIRFLPGMPGTLRQEAAIVRDPLAALERGTLEGAVWPDRQRAADEALAALSAIDEFARHEDLRWALERLHAGRMCHPLAVEDWSEAAHAWIEDEGIVLAPDARAAFDAETLQERRRVAQHRRRVVALIDECCRATGSLIIPSADTAEARRELLDVLRQRRDASRDPIRRCANVLPPAHAEAFIAWADARARSATHVPVMLPRAVANQ